MVGGTRGGRPIDDAKSSSDPAVLAVPAADFETESDVVPAGSPAGSDARSEPAIPFS
jgi:hypothetical protein